MKLSELLRDALDLSWSADTDPLISSVVQDHRLISAGSLFVARAGARFDGRSVLAEAAARGAVAAVAERSPLLQGAPLPVVIVADAEAATGPLAASLLGRPADQLTVTGVTGTDGKTTTAFLLRHLLSGQSRTALLSTAGSHDGEGSVSFAGHFTTPEAPEVQGFLRAALDAGSSQVVLEASSHALDRHRLSGVSFDLAVWTNLTPEHLDWHGTMDNYLRAKRSLVERAGTAVLNRDDPYFSSFAEAAGTVISYGFDPAADWRALGSQRSGFSQRLKLQAHGREFETELALPGDYNVLNALAALAAAEQLGVPLESAISRLADFAGVPGRMQSVQTTPFQVIVDFAHTGPALQRALTAVRAVTDGRLILVIGAAGERDHGKRAPLAQAAAAGADLIVFTEEDSRSEDTAAILEQLRTAALAAGAEEEQLVLEEDRSEAIRQAVGLARPGDVVLLAGKGVERTLERADGTVPWDEEQVARSWLERP